MEGKLLGSLFKAQSLLLAAGGAPMVEEDSDPIQTGQFLKTA